MRQRTSRFDFTLLLVFLFASGPASAASLVLCETIADNSPGDGNGAIGVITGACVFPLGSFTGSVREISTSSSYRIIATGVFTGIGSRVLATGDYNLLGAGVEWTGFSGSLTNQPGMGDGMSNDGLFLEFFRSTATASTFNNNSATAQWTAPAVPTALPLPVVGFNERNGFYSTQGTATALATWNASDDEQFDFPASAEYAFAVPEPSVLWLIGFGSGMVLRRMRRRASC